MTPAIAGTLGSYALVGVLVGALLAGSVGDIIGRRKVMLTAYAWFSVGMAVTALTTTTTTFGILRFVTGLGVGALVATTGALVVGIAPPGKKNLCNAITYSRRAARQPAGRAARHPAARAHRLARHVLDRRAADRHPAAAGLTSRCRSRWPGWSRAADRRGPRDVRADRRADARGRRPPWPRRHRPAPSKVGFAGLFSARLPAARRSLLGLMSATGLVLVYSLNTWLPELMQRAGFNAKGSLVVPAGAQRRRDVRRAGGSRLADRFGPKPVVAACFLIGALAHRRC